MAVSKILIWAWGLVLSFFPQPLLAGFVPSDSSNPLSETIVYLTLSDETLRVVVSAALILGACGGLMGAFLLVRKQAFLADTLAHAVLPGIALGFLWNLSKDTGPLLVGAGLSGLAGIGVVRILQKRSRHHDQAILGFVLATFFALGLCWLSMIRNAEDIPSAGIEHFLFGQIAAISDEDLPYIWGIGFLILAVVGLLYKEYLLICFDAAFARSLGKPASLLSASLLFLLTLAVVISLKAVGVVLVTALLIIPAATARLLTDSFLRMLIYSAVLGALAGWLGTLGSLLGPGLPTGPMVVLSATGNFLLALCLAPKRGWVVRCLRRREEERRHLYENLLKTLYHAEEASFEDGQPLKRLAEGHSTTPEKLRGSLAVAESKGFVQVDKKSQSVRLTSRGRDRARTIVRNHRLWELYLAEAANIAPDHVHDAAEAMEHHMDEETARKIEQRFGQGRLDPHGKPIPAAETRKSASASKNADA